MVGYAPLFAVLFWVGKPGIANNSARSMRFSQPRQFLTMV